MLLLHGTGPGAPYFAPLAAELSATRRVLAPSMPGYGRTPAISGPDALFRAEEHLVSDLHELGIREVDVVGTSGGAYRGLRIALDGPSRVSVLVSLGGVANLTEEHRAGLRALAALLRSGQHPVDVLVQAMLSPLAAQKAESRDWVASWLSATPPAVLAGELEAFASSTDMLGVLGARRFRLVARVGALDTAVPVARSEEMVARAVDGHLQESSRAPATRCFSKTAPRRTRPSGMHSRAPISRRDGHRWERPRSSRGRPRRDNRGCRRGAPVTGPVGFPTGHRPGVSYEDAGQQAGPMLRANYRRFHAPDLPFIPGSTDGEAQSGRSGRGGRRRLQRVVHSDGGADGLHPRRRRGRAG